MNHLNHVQNEDIDQKSQNKSNNKQDDQNSQQQTPINKDTVNHVHSNKTDEAYNHVIVPECDCDKQNQKNKTEFDFRRTRSR